MNDHQTVRIEPVTVRAGPLGFHVWARQFHEAGLTLGPIEPPKSRRLPVPYYLHCRGLELVLKAFLLGRGRGVEEMKYNFGHDLVKLLAACIGEGLGRLVELAEEDLTIVADANEHYAAKQFEYFEVSTGLLGFEEAPELEELRALMGRLLSGLEDFCMRATDTEPGGATDLISE